MRSTPLLLAALLAACGGDDSPGGTIDAAPGSPDAAPAGTPDAGPPRDPLIGIGTVERIFPARQFMFTEGPQWVAARGVLLFTDIPANRIYEYRPGPPAQTEPTAFTPTGNANGLALLPDGRLLAAEHSGRRVSVMSAPGQAATAVVDRFETKPFNSPNDVIARADGTIYFTDPPYGLGGADPDLDFMGVFRVPAGGTTAVAEWRGPATARPNGIALSPDQRTLYVADTDEGVVRAFNVAATGGALSGERIAVRGVAGADGMAVDAAGNLFIATRAGIRVVAPDGTPWGTIAVPQQPDGPSNCAFGGADSKTLFITARTGLYQVTLVGPGLPTN